MNINHQDDAAVDAFAVAMKAKMAASRAKGKSGWNDPLLCPTGRLQAMLVDHVAKGDPIDVANFCMMLFNRQAPTVSSSAAPSDEVRKALEAFVRCAYPVATSIHPRGHNWSGAYLDDALIQARAALATPSVQAVAAPVAGLQTAEIEPFSDFPEYHYDAMGCGLEDRNITDRYDAMKYGWDEAIDRVGERIAQYCESLAPAASPVELTDADIDKYLDAVLRASGSALKHYSMPKSLTDMRAAMRAAIGGA